MNLEEHYNKMWEQALHQFEEQEFEFDSLINSENDTRYGITLMARPSEEVQQNVSNTLEKLRAVAPNQYYYPNSDLHITVLSIISCSAGFALDRIDRPSTKKSFMLPSIPLSPFAIRFRGLTASPSSVMVQGFPEADRLKTLRNSLRDKFKKSGLHHSIDKRYTLQTAHMTVVRFKESLADAKKFVSAVSGLRDRDFGRCIIDRLKLVKNDWYHRQENVQLIEEFALNERD